MKDSGYHNTRADSVGFLLNPKSIQVMDVEFFRLKVFSDRNGFIGTKKYCAIPFSGEFNWRKKSSKVPLIRPVWSCLSTWENTALSAKLSVESWWEQLLLFDTFVIGTSIVG